MDQNEEYSRIASAQDVTFAYVKTMSSRMDRVETEFVDQLRKIETRLDQIVDLVRDVVAEACGRVPVLSTSGGTSDARYVKNHCPVLEFGLVGAFMHQVDERVPQAQVRQLKDIYQTKRSDTDSSRFSSKRSPRRS